MLRKGLETIAKEYETFLHQLREKNEALYDPDELRPLSKEGKIILKNCIKEQLKEIKKASKDFECESPEGKEYLLNLKEIYNKILQVGIGLSVLGKAPKIVTKGMSPFELFSAYHEFLEAGLCEEITREDVNALLEKYEGFLKGGGEDSVTYQEDTEKDNVISEINNMKDEIDEGEKKGIFTQQPNKTKFGKKKDNSHIIIKIRIKDGRILQFPNIIRHILSKATYFLKNSELNLTKEQIVDTLVLAIKNKDSSQEWIKELIKNNLLSYLHIKFQDPNIEEILRKYLEDLTEITNKLIIVNKGEILDVTAFCKDLVKDGFNFGSPVDSLKRIIKNLVEYLNENIPEFNIQKRKAKRVFDDGIYRECSKCHKRKLHKEFSKDKKNNLHAICKECTNKHFAIKHSIKKLKVITKIYEGRYKSGKCVKCGIYTIKLPCLTFHHLDRSIKKFTWNSVNSYDYNTIIRILEKEKVELVCFNCQKLIHASVFNRFKKIILDPNLYNYTMKEIETKISELRKKYHLKGGTSYIKYWMKKRIVINYLYNGRCAGCGKKTIHNNLPCLEFHHIDPNLTEEKLRWKNISQLNIKEIITMLLKERCLCLCKNCHELLTSHQFFKYSVEILGKIKGKLAKNEYTTLVNNIQKFNIVKNKRLYPILMEFTLDKAWKRALLCVFNIIKMNNINEYTNKELSNCLNDPQTKRFSRKLSDMKLISLLRYGGSNEKVYFLTKKGYDVITKMISF